MVSSAVPPAPVLKGVRCIVHWYAHYVWATFCIDLPRHYLPDGKHVDSPAFTLGGSAKISATAPCCQHGLFSPSKWPCICLPALCTPGRICLTQGWLKAAARMAWASSLEENPGAVCKQGAEQNIFFLNNWELHTWINLDLKNVVTDGKSPWLIS